MAVFKLGTRGSPLALTQAEMVRDALDSFVRKDARAALDVCRRDDEVDGLYKQLFRELLTYMMEDPRNTTRALHLLLVARNYERIADHATNIESCALLQCQCVPDV